MSWISHLLSLELRGDIHCGDLPLGFVARTFPYVPCHIPFFALVRVAVELLRLPDCHASYMNVEQLFRDCVRSTPLYIRDYDKTILFPWDAKSLETLEASYLGSRYGVALDNTMRSAKEGCLDETEVILASRRQSGQLPFTPTVLEGMLFIRANSFEDMSFDTQGNLSWKDKHVTLNDLLEHMQFGGDRRRSLGRPARVTYTTGDTILWEQYTVHCDGQWPILDIPQNIPGPMPVLMNTNDAVQGLPQLLTGRRYTDEGPGFGMDAAKTAFACGWKSAKDCSIELINSRFAQFASCGHSA